MDTSTKTVSSVEEKVEIKEGKPWNIIFHNDNHTSFELVIFILNTVLSKSTDDASALAFRIHNEGRAVVSAFHFEMAEQKTAECLQLARSYDAPLLVTMQQ